MNDLKMLIETGQDLANEPEALQSIEGTLDLTVFLLDRVFDFESDVALHESAMGFLRSFSARSNEDLKVAFKSKLPKYMPIIQTLESIENRTVTETTTLNAFIALFSPTRQEQFLRDLKLFLFALPLIYMTIRMLSISMFL